MKVQRPDHIRVTGVPWACVAFAISGSLDFVAGVLLSVSGTSWAMDRKRLQHQEPAGLS